MSEFRSRLMMMQMAGGGFPAELQKCEYVKGVSGGTRNQIVFKKNNLNYIRTQRNRIWICRISADRVDSVRYGFIVGTIGKSTGNCGWEIWQFDSLDHVTFAIHKNDGIVDVLIDEETGQVKVNGNNAYNFRISDWNDELSLNSAVFSCFTRNDNWSDNINVYSYIYGIEVIDNGVTAHKLVPCYVKIGKTYIDSNGNTRQAGEIGLYDIIEGVFYGNTGLYPLDKGADI